MSSSGVIRVPFMDLGEVSRLHHGDIILNGSDK